MTDPLDFTGKRVLVIGGSSGIGNGIAHGFRQRGAVVTVTGTRPDFGDYLEAEDSDFTGLDYRQIDLTDRSAADRLAADLGPLDVLVLSQGTVRYGRQEFTREGWDAVVDINLNSVMDAARAFHPALTASKGAIIIVSSVAAFKPTSATCAPPAMSSRASAWPRPPQAPVMTALWNRKSGFSSFSWLAGTVGGPTFRLENFCGFVSDSEI